MSENRIFLDHDLLVAYVDRELPPDRLAAVEAALLHDAVRRLMDRGVLQQAVGVEFRRAWYLLVLDRWFTAFA